MRRIQDTNVGPGDTFISANPGTNTPGTIVRKDHKNDVQEELCRAIESTGQAVDTTLYSSGPGNRDQIAQMAAHYGAGGASYFIEDVTSAADAYVIKPVQIAIRDRQAPASLFERQQVIFVAGNTNTGASTIDVSLLLGEILGTTIVDMKLKGGVSDPSSGDLQAGTEVVLIYRSSPSPHFEIANPAQNFIDLKSGRKNFWQNPNCDIWQRAITGSGAGYPSIDRMRTVSSGITKFDQVDVSASIPEAKYGIEIESTSAIGLIHRIEQQNSKLLFSKTVTLSFWASADEACTLEIGAELPTAGIDDFSTTSIVNKDTIVIDGTLRKYTSTFNLNESNVRDFGVGIIIWEQGNVSATKTLTLAKFQLEVGQVATDFEYRPIAEEEMICFRYYTETSSQGFAVRSKTSGSNGTAHLPVPMRTTPTATRSGVDQVYGVDAAVNAAVSANVTGVTVSDRKGQMNVNHANIFTGTGAGGWYFGTIALDAEL